MTCGVMAQRLETEEGSTYSSRKEADVIHSFIACGDACHEAGRPGCSALLIEDATYIDPMMDAWGQEMAACLIEGLVAVFRGLSGAVGKLGELVPGSAKPRAPGSRYTDRPSIASVSSRPAA